MLDKSIPWHSFIMSLDPADLVAQINLEAGFSLRSYESDKDGLSWAEIETAVGEFDSIEEAMACHRHYLEHIEELKKRQWFVVDENDNAVATCTVWWYGDEKIPCIHALSCLPKMQGRGFGKAALLAAINSTIQNDKRTIWLETQTFSWKAICLYLSAGFVPRMEATFNQTPNEFSTSYGIISEKVGEKINRLILKKAVK